MNIKLDNLTGIEHLPEFQEYLELISEEQERKRHNIIVDMYPDQGTDGQVSGYQPVDWNPELGVNPHWPRGAQGEFLEPCRPELETWSRKFYPQQLEFFAAGAEYQFRLMMAANQVGKSTSAGYEVALHATGEYPSWWTGLRFDRPPRIIIGGEDYDILRRSVQLKLLGPVGDPGSGMIPRRCLDLDTLPEAKKATTFIPAFRVRHRSGGYSTIDIKSYAGGVADFYAVQADLIWLDEEPPEDIYEECKTRTITTGGRIMMTFTPLLGMTRTIENFLDGGDFRTGPVVDKSGNPTARYVVQARWTDVPHISYTAIKNQLSGMPVHLRDAKSQGRPVLGSGAVYPVNENQVFIDPFPIPQTWPRVASIDFGWEDPTAVLWMAINPDTREKYVYSEHYASHQTTGQHAEAIRSRYLHGWQPPMVCDPAGGGRSQADGRLTREIYRNEHSITMTPADNSIAPGIQTVLTELVAGRLKIFVNCVETRREFRMYRYQKGKLCGDDHAMDALRYLIVSGTDLADTPPRYTQDVRERFLPTRGPRF